jgi:hypothetical protein
MQRLAILRVWCVGWAVCGRVRSTEISENLAALLAQSKRAAAVADRCGSSGGTRQRLQQKLAQRKQAARIAQLQELTAAGDAAAGNLAAAAQPATALAASPDAQADGDATGSSVGGERADVIDLTEGLEGATLGGGGGVGRGDEGDLGGDSLALAWLSQKHRHGAGAK